MICALAHCVLVSSISPLAPSNEESNVIDVLTQLHEIASVLPIDDSELVFEFASKVGDLGDARDSLEVVRLKHELIHVLERMESNPVISAIAPVNELLEESLVLVNEIREIHSVSTTPAPYLQVPGAWTTYSIVFQDSYGRPIDVSAWPEAWKPKLRDVHVDADAEGFVGTVTDSSFEYLCTGPSDVTVGVGYESGGVTYGDDITITQDDLACRIRRELFVGDPIRMRLTHPVGTPILPMMKPVPLAARGIDPDQLDHICPDSEGGVVWSTQAIPDSVEFEWKIVSESLGGAQASVTAERFKKGTLQGVGESTNRGRRMAGDSVYYLPPYLLCDGFILVKLELRCKDVAAVRDDPQDRVAEFEMKVERLSTDPTNYKVTILNRPQDDITFPSGATLHGDGECFPTQNIDAEPPIQFLGATHPQQACPKEDLILSIAGADADSLELKCRETALELSVHDPVTVRWTSAGGGEFVTGAIGSYVAWRAPRTLGPCTITAEIIDSGLWASDTPHQVQFTIEVTLQPHLDRIVQLEDQLKTRRETWRTAGDHRWGFAENHLCMSAGIRALAMGGSLQDPCWILRLDEAFLKKFFDALNAWESRRLDTLPTAWHNAFRIANRIQQTPGWPNYTASTDTDRVILIMASAHIFYDITTVLTEEGCGPQPDFAAIESVVDSCSEAWMGTFRDNLRQVAVSLGIPGANAIVEWRNKVWNYVARCGPHPSK